MRIGIYAYLALFISTTCPADTKVVDGLYFPYEGAEYESAFVPCSSSDTWFIEGDEAIEELGIKYRKLPRGKYGEIRVSLELVIEPIDKSTYPNSHYEAIANVKSILKAEYDVKKFETCRE